jgi:hypothetical protein
VKEIKPKRIFEELAELGVLGDLLQYQWREFYEQDEKFREDVNEILLKYSPGEVTVLEKYLLEQLCQSLQFFIDYTQVWMNRRL